VDDGDCWGQGSHGRPRLRATSTVHDFQLRISSRGEWGQTSHGWDNVELVLTAGRVERLVGMLSEGD
jgi:hypothetical protein